MRKKILIIKLIKSNLYTLVIHHQVFLMSQFCCNFSHACRTRRMANRRASLLVSKRVSLQKLTNLCLRAAFKWTSSIKCNEKFPRRRCYRPSGSTISLDIRAGHAKRLELALFETSNSVSLFPRVSYCVRACYLINFRSSIIGDDMWWGWFQLYLIYLLFFYIKSFEKWAEKTDKYN